MTDPATTPERDRCLGGQAEPIGDDPPTPAGDDDAEWDADGQGDDAEHGRLGRHGDDHLAAGEAERLVHGELATLAAHADEQGVGQRHRRQQRGHGADGDREPGDALGVLQARRHDHGRVLVLEGLAHAVASAASWPGPSVTRTATPPIASGAMRARPAGSSTPPAPTRGS